MFLLSSFVFTNFQPGNKWFGVKICSLPSSNKAFNGLEFKLCSISKNNNCISVKIKQVRAVVFFMHLLTDSTNLSQKPPNHGAFSGLKIYFIFLYTSNNCALLKAKTGLLPVKTCLGKLCVKYILLN